MQCNEAETKLEIFAAYAEKTHGKGQFASKSGLKAFMTGYHRRHFIQACFFPGHLSGTKYMSLCMYLKCRDINFGALTKHSQLPIRLSDEVLLELDDHSLILETPHFILEVIM